MYREKKRERRRRDFARTKAAVKRYSWYDEEYATPATIGRAARANHTCFTCGNDRRNFGPSFAEIRQRLKGA